MDQKSKKFLYQYLDNSSPTGSEAKGQQLWLNYLSPYVDTHFCDAYGTAVGVLNPQSPYKVVIEAHADEIGWRINYISEDGYLYVIRNGGSDHQIAPSMRVRIHIDKGKYLSGIFGWPAIHTRQANKEEAPSMKNIFIDIGASSRKEAEKMGIQVGQVMTFEDSLMEMGPYWVGRGLDNRVGGFMIAEVARGLAKKKNKLPYGLYIVNAVQEEVGLRGAEMISRRIKPNVALVTDVCHDTQSPPYNKKEQGDIQCAKGPVLSYGASVHAQLNDEIEKAAKISKIPFQRMAAGRYTGTDADAFAYSNEGVPSALLSLPLKYMHTTVEMAHSKDMKQLINLMEAFLWQLKGKEKFSYL